jgi:hypothetical protein
MEKNGLVRSATQSRLSLIFAIFKFDIDDN